MSDGRLSVSTTGSGIYSRQCEEGDGEDTEARGDGFSNPRLRYLVSITNGGDSHLETGEIAHFNVLCTALIIFYISFSI